MVQMVTVRDEELIERIYAARRQSNTELEKYILRSLFPFKQ